MSLTSAQLRRLKTEVSNGSGNRVRAARAIVKMTQQQLADAVGLTQTTLSDIERQRYGTITLDTARKFAEFFGCAIEDLFPAKQEVA
jgi:putative transcriptional regulator